jgi:flagellar biosynthesis/type III secretory pathway protein FliH
LNDDLQEIKVMLAQRLEEWAHGYKAEGVLEGIRVGKQEGVLEGMWAGKQEGIRVGRQEGEILALQKLLTKRFGSLPANYTALIAGASLSDIEYWFEQAIDAKQLADVFKSS